MDVVEVLDTARGPMLWFECPGCGENHGLPVGDETCHPRWTFNGNKQKPTITPSILSRSTVPITDEQHAALMRGDEVKPVDVVCHSFVRDGQIQFLGDCTHALAGQTVSLKPVQKSGDK